jgi:hypothetical protein
MQFHLSLFCAMGLDSHLCWKVAMSTAPQAIKKVQTRTKAKIRLLTISETEAFMDIWDCGVRIPNWCVGCHSSTLHLPCARAAAQSKVLGKP